MKEFLEKQEKIITPQEALIHKDIHERTSLRFIDYNQINRQDENEEEESNQEESYRDGIHIELAEENLDKIIFPTKLEIILDKERLLELED